MNRRNFLTKPWLWAVAAVFPVKAVAQSDIPHPVYSSDQVYELTSKLQVQLAGCLMASGGSKETQAVKRGDYAWTLGLEQTNKLWLAHDELKKHVEKLREMKEVACVQGTIDYDPYFLGMANGIIFALCTLDDDAPQYMSAPKGKWGYERRDHLSAKRWFTRIIQRQKMQR